MLTLLLASFPLLAALLWTASLMVNSAHWDDGAVFLMGFGLLATASVAFVGTVMTGGRWARRASLATQVGCVGIAVVRPLDALWVGSLTATGMAIAALLWPRARSLTRRLPSATGPPEPAVLLTIALIAVPFVLGFSAWDGTNTATLIVGVAAPFTALWYSRVFPGGLYAARYLWPSAALVLAPFQPGLGAVFSAVIGIVVHIIARDPSVKVAFYPPRERGSSYPIPPELTPQEILDAADIDETGRKR